jgi:hypothetical protein
MAELLERGDVFFAYRPRVGEEYAGELADVQRLWMILSPRERVLHRRIVVGKKRLPRRRERHWAYVDQVAHNPLRLVDDLHETHSWTKTRGMRRQATARAHGEGVYALVRDPEAKCTRLIYKLELTEEPGDVQHDLGLRTEGAFIATAFATVGPRKFTQVTPEILDREGEEIILIGASDDLGIDLPVDRSVADSADIFRGLAMEDSEHPLRTLFDGMWA